LADLPTKSKRIAVLGEMGELGDSAQQEHQQIGQQVAELKIDYFIGIGPLQKLAAEQAIKSGMRKEQVFWAKDVMEGAKILKKILSKGDLFYLKGSLLRHMERIILLLKNQKLDCKVISCHNYNQCDVCPKL